MDVEPGFTHNCKLQSRFNRNGANIVGQHHIDLLVNVDVAVAVKGWGGGGGEAGVKQEVQTEREERLFEDSVQASSSILACKKEHFDCSFLRSNV